MNSLLRYEKAPVRICVTVLALMWFSSLAMGDFPGYGTLRTMHPDFEGTREELLIRGEASVCSGQLGLLPWIAYELLEEMEAYHREAVAYAQMCHSHGVLAGSYMNFSSAIENNTTDPNDMVVLKTWNAWEELTQYLGPKPETGPLQWLQSKPNGEIADPMSFMGINYFMFCPNNPGVLEWGKAQITFLVRAGIDCVYNDEIRFAGDSDLGLCYCSYCKQAFRTFLSEKYSPGELQQYYGITDIDQVNLPVSSDDVLWGESSKFGSLSKANYLGQVRDYAHSLSPDFSLTASLFITSDLPSIVLANYSYDPNIIQEGLDYVFFDYGGGWTPNEGYVFPLIWDGHKLSNSVFYKMALAVAGGLDGKPAVMHHPEYMDLDFPDLYRLAFLGQAEATMCGVAREIHLDPYFAYGETPAAFKNGECDFLSFIADNEIHLNGCVDYANVALLEDTESMQWGSWDYEKYSYFMPIGRLLIDYHIPYEMISKSTLESADLSRFKLLILAYSPCLSDEVSSRIISFVQSGGALLSYGISGELDENGHLRSSNALSIIYEAIGINPQIPPSSIVTGTLGSSEVAYVPKSAWTGWHLVPGELEFDVVGLGKFELLGPEFTQIPWLVDLLTDSLIVCRTDADDRVEINPMYNPTTDQLLVHLMNYQLYADGSFESEDSVEVSIMLPEGKAAASATLEIPNESPQSLDIEATDDFVSFIVAQLDAYALCILQLEDEVGVSESDRNSNSELRLSIHCSPNPFSSFTRIHYTIPKQKSVSIHIFDINGRLVTSLTEKEPCCKGSYTREWNGKNSLGGVLASGSYFYRLTAGDAVVTKRLVLLR